MGDQDQQNGEGQSDQQNQTDGQSQSNAQTPPADGTQSQGDGQSSAADSQSDTGQSSTAQQTHSTSSGQAEAVPNSRRASASGEIPALHQRPGAPAKSLRWVAQSGARIAGPSHLGKQQRYDRSIYSSQRKRRAGP